VIHGGESNQGNAPHDPRIDPQPERCAAAGHLYESTGAVSPRRKDRRKEVGEPEARAAVTAKLRRILNNPRRRGEGCGPYWEIGVWGSRPRITVREDGRRAGSPVV